MYRFVVEVFDVLHGVSCEGLERLLEQVMVVPQALQQEHSVGDYKYWLALQSYQFILAIKWYGVFNKHNICKLDLRT